MLIGEFGSELCNFISGVIVIRRGENIYKRKDGRWEGRYICGKDNNGKSQYKSVYGRSYIEVKEKIKNSEVIQYSAKFGCLSDIAELWLSSVKLKNRLSTYSCYNSLFDNHIKEEIGSVNIEYLNCKHIEDLLDAKAHLSTKTRNDILMVINQILKHAETSGYHVNHTINNLSVHQEKKVIRVLDKSERKRLTEFLLDNSDKRKIGVYLALSTGIRIGELCALQRKNLDFNSAVIYITSTVQRVKNPSGKPKTLLLQTEPKSHSSIRDIPIPDYLLKVLKIWYDYLEPEQYILTGKEKLIEPRVMRFHFDKYMSQCKVENAKFHTLRHTFATKCIECGMDVKTLSEILGHSDVNITLSRYVHSSMELKRENMNKISDGE